jgi:hypothetical protein
MNVAQYPDLIVGFCEPMVTTSARNPQTFKFPRPPYFLLVDTSKKLSRSYLTEISFLPFFGGFHYAELITINYMYFRREKDSWARPVSIIILGIMLISLFQWS